MSDALVGAMNTTSGAKSAVRTTFRVCIEMLKKKRSALWNLEDVTPLRATYLKVVWTAIWRKLIILEHNRL